MLKKIIIPLGIILALLIPLGHCYIPLPYHHTIHAFKIDAEGNKAGDVEITLDGKMMASLFRKDSLRVDVGSIENTSGFDVDTSKLERHFIEDFLYYSFVIDDITGLVGSVLDEDSQDTAQSMSQNFYVCISPDFDQWFISVSVNGGPKVYYIGSVSGSKTYDQLTEYFASKLPN